MAPTAVLIGDVTVETGASIWYGVVLRGDQGPIVIRRGANVQDNSVCHVDGLHPTIVGENATIGHAAVLESCTIERGALVGMKAVVMNGAVVGEESMIAAGAVVTEGMEVPSRHLAAGVPAVVKKELSGRSMEWVKMAAPDYHELSAAYLEQGLGEA
ncbi:MAG TPA: gamma carbonic anhydrase family protein [Chloroflexota bacterium]